MHHTHPHLFVGSPRSQSSHMTIFGSRANRKLRMISFAILPGIQVFTNSADARSLAITEFLNNPIDHDSWLKNGPTVS